ncbi:MAG: hypothetical protein WBW85_17660 [Terriglobales bacterium]
MTWESHSVTLYLWCAQPVLQTAAAVILWHRKVHKQFPAFFLFLIAQDINFAVIFPLWLVGNVTFYFWLFWLGEAVNALLGFKVIHEVFLDVFRPYHTLKDLGTLLFKWAGVVMLMVSVVVAFSNSSDRSLLVHAVTTLQRSVRIVQVGLILFMLLFSRFLGVSRKQISFGISLGFGLFASAELILMALNSGGYVKEDLFNTINMVSYLAAALAWVGYSLSPKAVREVGANHLQTQRWEQGLADLQHPSAPDSLIPMFEGMVERAFSRSSNLDAAEDRVPPANPLTQPKVRSAAAGTESRK